ncbi:MAG: hypothetical protein M1825_000873 [Sarcosagium campestre]|nr:MAG: hypothetical protein M1825_000873 [Sarcosagium campestre]
MADILRRRLEKSSEPVNPKAKDGEESEKRPLPKGVVLGKDGKPCRSCTSFASWKAMTKKETSSSSSSSASSSDSTTASPSISHPSIADTNSDCPADVERLGNHTWTFLHTMSANYPSTADSSLQSEMTQFLGLFSKLYPCWSCADDLRAWMKEPGNEPRVKGRADLGDWMCRAHNEVNRKLGKPEFDCRKWEERWRTGWADGRCG